MLGWNELIISFSLSLALSLGTTAFIWRPLREVLARLCDSPATTHFWSAFAAVIFILGPLAIVAAALVPSRPLVEHVRYALLLSSLGIMSAFALMGAVIMANVERRLIQKSDAAPNQIPSA